MRPEERLAALLCRKHGYHDGDRTPCHLCWVEAAVLIAAGVSVPTESGAPDPLRRTWQEGWDAAMRFASQPVPAPEPSARLREAAQRYVAAREAYIACNDDENEEPCGHWHDQHEAYDDLRDAATPQDPEA